MDGLRKACDQRVGVLDTRDYVAVSPHTPLSNAIEAMKNDEGGCVIISDDGRVAGIFTERDLLTKVLGQNVDMDETRWLEDLIRAKPDQRYRDATTHLGASRKANLAGEHQLALEEARRAQGIG